MLHVNTKTTLVRTAVARFESTPVTPIFAKTAVSPAKKADSSAQKIQFMESFRHDLLAPTLRRSPSLGIASFAKERVLLTAERNLRRPDLQPLVATRSQSRSSLKFQSVS